VSRIVDLVGLSDPCFFRAWTITGAEAITREPDEVVRGMANGQGEYLRRVARLELARREALS